MRGSVEIWVTARVFSGRRNPRWRYPEPAALLRRVGALAPVACPQSGSRGLGYRGLRLDLSDGFRRERLDLNRGVLSRGSRCFTDTARALERQILQTGRAAIPEEVYLRIIAKVS